MKTNPFKPSCVYHDQYLPCPDCESSKVHRSKVQQKRTQYRNKKILAAARDEPCLVNLPGCTGGGADTSAAHSNQIDDGKGGSQKADDIFVAFACLHCHDILDGRKHSKDFHCDYDDYKREIIWYHDRGIKRTIRRLIDKEVIK